MSDAFGAFVPGPRVQVPATGDGVLRGMTVAIKDLIDVRGTITGGGNPDWAAAQQPASAHATAVERLLQAGAAINGKTITDELAFSLEGDNAHYGTPINPACPDCLPGGSSSGSAVAVAAHLVDSALGTDTGGSVRVPAAFCGIFGFRPTHGRVPLHGVIPFAPDYDTIGWFARDAETLQLVGSVLLDAPVSQDGTGATTLLIARDAFDLADPACASHLLNAAALLGASDTTSIFGGGADLWSACYQILQGAQIRRSLGPWINARKPRFGANIAPRFAQIMEIDDETATRYNAVRSNSTTGLDRLLQKGTVLLVPTTPCTALPIDATPQRRADFYHAALAINAIAGHAGLPQITVPAGLVEGRPVGLSFIGARGTDEALLKNALGWTQKLHGL
jgi:amidase